MNTLVISTHGHNYIPDTFVMEIIFGMQTHLGFLLPRVLWTLGITLHRYVCSSHERLPAWFTEVGVRSTWCHFWMDREERLRRRRE